MRRKLAHYTDIRDEDWAILAPMEEVERPIAAKQIVREAGAPADELFVVKSGWFYSYVLLPDGRRQIISLHHPGDVIGFSDIAFTRANETVVAASNGVLCPFPKQCLNDVFAKTPRVAAVLFALSARDRLILTDLVKATGRMIAQEKLAYLLMSIYSRLKVTAGETNAKRFRLPLTQTEIGDTIGLTNVYVSKSFSVLEENGLIRRQQGEVEIVSIEALGKLCDYQDRHARMDTSWFPDRLSSGEEASSGFSDG